MDLGLQKKELAGQLDVDETTIHNWEDKGITPAIRFIPRINEFLGYDPQAGGSWQSGSLAERLKAHRRKLGLSRKKLATLLGTDESNLAGWESGQHKPTKKSMDLISDFLLWSTIRE